jgi:hypothetical protein
MLSNELNPRAFELACFGDGRQGQLDKDHWLAIGSKFYPPFFQIEPPTM